MVSGGLAQIKNYTAYRKVKSVSRVQLFVTPWTVATRLLCPRDFPGNSTGVDCHFLLQGIFETQGSNPGLPHCRQTLYCLSHQGSVRDNYSPTHKVGILGTSLLRPVHTCLEHQDKFIEHLTISKLPTQKHNLYRILNF